MRLSLDRFAKGPRMRRALHRGSPHEQARFVAKPTQFLLIVAEEKVISAVWHEYLVTHVAGGQATGSGISRSRSTPRVQTLNERSLG